MKLSQLSSWIKEFESAGYDLNQFDVRLEVLAGGIGWSGTLTSMTATVTAVGSGALWATLSSIDSGHED